MNKKILLGIAVLAIAVVSVVNVNFNSRNNKLSDVSLANVEALADEGGNSGTTDCWAEVSSSQVNAMSAGLTHKTYCGDCTAILCRSWYDSSKC